MTSELAEVQFLRPPAPRASVLVLAWKNADCLAHCLEALAHNLPPDLAEVVILLNGASDEVRNYVRQCVSGTVVIASDVNLGFAGGCNRAASAASGEYFVLLNDDTAVEPGWLTALIETADEIPEAGAVGSRVLFPDGSLQEAGCFIWDDGSTMAVGRHAPPGSRAYSYRRYVDYCSACSLLARRSAWVAVGGMDETYYPAYYEDVDFCLALRERGWRSVYEPRSRVRHFESASSDARFKEFLFRQGQRQFASKWADRLREFEPANPTSPAAVERAIRRAHGTGRHVLVVDDREPDPALGSGSGRMRQALEQLVTAGNALTFFPSADPVPDPEPLGRLGIEVLQGDLDAHLARAAVLYDAVLISRPHNYDRYAASVRRYQPQAALVYDAEALFWRRAQRLAALRGTCTSVESRDLEATERRIARDADRVICISRSEAQWFRSHGAASVDIVAPFWPAVAVQPERLTARSGLLYVAGWLGGAESPNGDGLAWFLREILPLIRVGAPDVRLSVTGRVPEALAGLGDAAVDFTGQISAVADAYARARVIVAPVRYGAGVKLKVVEAMQHGLPIVTTSIGAEGIRLWSAGALRVTDRPARFAEDVVTLLADDRAWRRQREATLAVVAEWHARHSPARWASTLTRAQLARQPDAIARRVTYGASVAYGPVEQTGSA